jgi:tRNA(Ile2) C34 agmatinyltransferase TiaS
LKTLRVTREWWKRGVFNTEVTEFRCTENTEKKRSEETEPIESFRVGRRGRGDSQVWQAKSLREGVFGCVANKGLAGEISEVWQGKGLAGF